jgi:hypothetical protein
MTTSATPRLLLEPPPGFVGLPLGESDEDNATNLRRLADTVAARSGQNAGRMTEHLRVLAAIMARNQVRLFGRFAIRTDDGEPVLAGLTLAMPALAGANDIRAKVADNRAITAAALLRRHRKHDPHAMAGIITLPIGPAVVAASAGDYRLPPGPTGKPRPVVRPEFKAKFQIPAPDGTHLIVMTVTTDSEAGWPTVAGEALRVARSMKFERPPDDRQAAHGRPEKR